MTAEYFTTPLSRFIWDTRYRYRDSGIVLDKDVDASWRRVAHALARVEAQGGWEEAFYQLLADFRFLPAGRIMAGAGSSRRVTLFNCFVMGGIEDSMEGIFTALKEGALTMQQGGGVGYDFSSLRPSGSHARRIGGIASGPVSFMRIWDSMCATLLSTGARRGAMMATLRCDHPDILAFIDAKRDPRELRHFNLSVLVSDAFMQAVDDNADWALVFPAAQLQDADSDADKVLVERDWPGHETPVACRVVTVLPATAAELMRTLCHAAYRSSAQLAGEKGRFPAFEADRFLHGPFVQTLPADIRSAIASRGLRNSHLIAIAPTGTISLLANNISSGLEPVFEACHLRRIRQPDGSLQEYKVVDYACRLWQNEHGPDSLPPAFVDARSVAPEVHLQMQATIQRYVDNAISKTINIPEDCDFAGYRSVFEQAYAMGLKGCTMFRPNPVTGSVLSVEEAGKTDHPHCCDIDREAD